MRGTRIWLAAGIATLFIAAAFTYAATRDEKTNGGTSPLARFSEQDVTVSISIKDRSPTHATLVATLTPDRPGFHLYSIDLPASGIHGVGRPITLVPQGALTTAGQLTAEVKATTLPLAGTDLLLPVYPDGPVTVDLPVTITGRGASAVLVGYAACSNSNCLPPVSSHRVDLTIG